jgi:hypothetical protein
MQTSAPADYWRDRLDAEIQAAVEERKPVDEAPRSRQTQRDAEIRAHYALERRKVDNAETRALQHSELGVVAENMACHAGAAPDEFCDLVDANRKKRWAAAAGYPTPAPPSAPSDANMLARDLAEFRTVHMPLHAMLIGPPATGMSRMCEPHAMRLLRATIPPPQDASAGPALRMEEVDDDISPHSDMPPLEDFDPADDNLVVIDESAFMPRKHLLVERADGKIAAIEAGIVHANESISERNERRRRELVAFYDRCNVEHDKRPDPSHSSIHHAMQLLASEEQRATMTAQLANLKVIVRTLEPEIKRLAAHSERTEIANIMLTGKRHAHIRKLAAAKAALAKMRTERDAVARALVAARPTLDAGADVDEEPSTDEESRSQWEEDAILSIGESLAAGQHHKVDVIMANMRDERDKRLRVAQPADRTGAEAMAIATAVLAESERDAAAEQAAKKRAELLIDMFGGYTQQIAQSRYEDMRSKNEYSSDTIDNFEHGLSYALNWSMLHSEQFVAENWHKAVERK